jgi:hypothetical protein
MTILLVQPLKNVEEEGVVGDCVAEVTLGVSHALHLATVVTHREIALDKLVQCGIKVKRARFTVVDKLVLDRALDLACGNAVLPGDVEKPSGPLLGLIVMSH